MTAEPIDDDRELAQFRQQYYGLLVNLLSREPTAEVLAALGAGISERAEAARALHPLLGEGWDRLAKLLPALTAASAEEEFLALFIGPFQPAVNAYESWYLTGQLFQAPLIAVRRFLAQVGLERKEAEYPEPEDALAFELEVMNWMLTRQLAAASAEEGREWLHRQSAFLKDHLLIWAPKFTEDLETAEKARLYGGVNGRPLHRDAGPGAAPLRFPARIPRSAVRSWVFQCSAGSQRGETVKVAARPRSG
jgi:TorA maturation chaperone TorD